MVLPPKHLLHPVLPTRVNGKLLFHLCRTCAFEKRENCTHADSERQFCGAWASCELYKAMDMGYRVVNIAEVYHYTQWSEGKNGVFVGYINAFLKTKQEASGWPKWAKTEDQRQQYISDYEHREGIKLEANNISEEGNPGLRSLSKLGLNSFWVSF